MLSNRLIHTDMPMINKVGELVNKVQTESNCTVDSLVQGMVYFDPPTSCTTALVDYMSNENTNVHKYCEHDFGTRVLREAILNKLVTENGLVDHAVIVTQGANQGFASVVNACCDPDDECVIFSPYYFNHLMSLQMANVKPVVVETKIENKYLPVESDFDNLQKLIDNGRKIKMVIVTTPCNPTGSVFGKSILEFISDFCKRNKIWMICDETYEYFIFDQSEPHYTPSGSHIIHLYSFSKAFGLMGWRVGYIAFDKNLVDLQSSLHKYQDTVPISCSVASQVMALQALKEGKQWALERINTLQQNREYLWDALSPYPTSVHTQGAMYFFAQFPNFANRSNVTIEEEWKVIEWLIRKHKVAVLPGSVFGYTGYFRVSYANINAEKCQRTAIRLSTALKELSSSTDSLHLDQF